VAPNIPEEPQVPIIDIDTDDDKIKRLELEDGNMVYGVPENWTFISYGATYEDFDFWLSFLFLYDSLEDKSFELYFLRDQLARQFPNYKWDYKINSTWHITNQVQDCLLETIEPVIDLDYYEGFRSEVIKALYIHQLRNIVVFMYHCFNANYLCPGSSSRTTSEATTESFGPFKSRLVALAIKYDLDTETDFN
jgi:hypothetical protein